MILNISGRTDIVAFYTPWLMKRFEEGFIDVRNPFNKKLVSRIYLEDVDLILFCTKNPTPILKYISSIKKPILFHITLTSYKTDIEPNILSKDKIVEAIKEISNNIGRDNVVVRYDPIFLSEKYTIEYHKKAFERLCSLLEGYVNKIIVSFVDDYKNVRKNKDILNYIDFTEADYEQIGRNFSNSAKRHNMSVQTCFEERNLSEYGFEVGECISKQLAYMLTGKKYKSWSARKCSCAQTVDIGVYNTCSHFCKYCYANFDEEEVLNNMSKHNPNSSLLIGDLEEGDIIKVRKK